MLFLLHSRKMVCASGGRTMLDELGASAGTVAVLNPIAEAAEQVVLTLCSDSCAKECTNHGAFAAATSSAPQSEHPFEPPRLQVVVVILITVITVLAVLIVIVVAVIIVFIAIPKFRILMILDAVSAGPSKPIDECYPTQAKPIQSKYNDRVILLARRPLKPEVIPVEYSWRAVVSINDPKGTGGSDTSMMGRDGGWIELQPVIQSEDIVVHIVLARTSGYQAEELAEVKRIVTSDLDASGDEDDQALARISGLHIHGLDGVLDRPDGLELPNDVLWSLKLLTFERHHGCWVEQTRETVDIGVEGLVEVLDEALATSSALMIVVVFCSVYALCLFFAFVLCVCDACEVVWRQEDGYRFLRRCCERGFG
eukprot:CAMPEP_0198107996 /NCGR_PEP_ID=MMETSP1442-20131203/78_1 /TAXON_ID= /ORGANISM="Craspedostauros australis, Strain CCMP3328" /LENGTH=367 /DNA_ID=CAMNT_0043763175 /DNA_START=96 /DNA_END=1197 /DNA_ORIENTATION=-